MATALSTLLSLPPHMAARAFSKIASGSTIATLGNPTPMLFGETEFFDFDLGEAEYVGEGANKSGSTITRSAVRVKPWKFQKTIRVSEEFMWADEDYQMAALNRLTDLIPAPLARALDYGVYHGINPLDGSLVAAMTAAGKLSQTSKSVEITNADKPYANVDAAVALVLASSYAPNGIAIDPTYGARFAAARGVQSEQKLYPDFTLETSPTGIVEGLRSSTSKTVGAVGVAAAATNVKAFVGDFTKIVWGVQRNIGVTVIEFGDPDGGGDLKRNNQVALRAEILYGWAIADLNAFCKVIDAVGG